MQSLKHPVFKHPEYVESFTLGYQRCLIVLALFAALRYRRRLRPMWHLIVPAVVLTAMYSMIHMEGRYLLSAVPALCAMATVAAVGGERDSDPTSACTLLGPHATLAPCFGIPCGISGVEA
ncbi:MAG: hypothetical protein FJX76_03400 [Armatimonadetes bacterium]|nr:hypothetical protein [Armatimonadota bacterium]